MDHRHVQEAKTLLEAGYAVVVLAWDRESNSRRRMSINGTTVFSFGSNTIRNTAKPTGLAFGAVVFQVILAVQSLRLINELKQRPIIHCHDFNTILPGCLLRALGLSSGLVYDCHELSYAAYSDMYGSFVGRIVNAIEGLCLSHVDAVIIVTEAQDYLRKFKPPVELIRNCPEMSSIPKLSKTEARLKLRLPLDKFIVSWVGTIRYDVRVDLLLSVASLAKRDDVQFVIVGGGPSSAEIWRQAHQMPDAPITLVGRVSRNEALLYVLASDITWAVYRPSPNSRGGMPSKFFDSLACGVPVIVEKDSIRAQLVNKLGCGLILENDDPACIAKTLLKLAENRDSLGALSDRAREAGKTESNWEEMSRRLIELYEGLRKNLC